MSRSLTSALYSVARMAAWSRAIGKAAQGNPHALVTRLKNRVVYQAVRPLLK